MEECPYCGKSSVSEKPFEKTLDTPKGTYRVEGFRLECSNPLCEEPRRFSYEQFCEMTRQLEEQGAFA